MSDSVNDIASACLGYLSITAWLFAQFPQLLKNWRNKTAESLSVAFLANWLLGDVCNLLGCLLTNQLPFQVRSVALPLRLC
ncbi:PQ loop repeat-domain-containing protein [Entophlyctis helioformis]|nr:PQ loop repeat-domain-containing protein [Entophlyctis helioformis]